MIESPHQTEMLPKIANFELIKKTFLKQNYTPILIKVIEQGQAKETIINPTYEGIKAILQIYPFAQIEITFENDNGKAVFKINQ